jgi:hypothetical protein
MDRATHDVDEGRTPLAGVRPSTVASPDMRAALLAWLAAMLLTLAPTEAHGKDPPPQIALRLSYIRAPMTAIVAGIQHRDQDPPTLTKAYSVRWMFNCEKKS